MKINQNNYEVFFIDYYDGTLSAEQSAELFLFLESHPELKAEFDNFSNIQLDVPEFLFPNRDSLKKIEIADTNIDQQLIANLEGDSSMEENRALESLIQSNPKHKRDAELFKATVSVPDLSVVFPDKKSLKKPAPFFIVYRNEIRYGIAAMLLLAFVAGMVSMFNRTMEQKTIQVAEEKSVVKSSGEFQSGRPDTAGRPVADSQIQNLPIEKIKQSAKQPTAGINVPEKKSGQINKQFRQPDNEMPVVTEVPVQLAEAVPAHPLPLIQENLQAEAQSLTGITQQPVANSGEQYLTVWEALQQSSEKNLKKLVAKENPVLAYADDTEDSKPTLVDIVSKGLEKVSNDKVKLDADKQSRRYSFSAGNFKIEKR